MGPVVKVSAPGCGSCWGGSAGAAPGTCWLCSRSQMLLILLLLPAPVVVKRWQKEDAECSCHGKPRDGSTRSSPASEVSLTNCSCQV